MAATDRALALLTERHLMRVRLTAQAQECERFLKLEERPPRLLRGEDKAASATESVVLAWQFQKKRMRAAAARFAADALAMNPKLADNLSLSHRYNAACCAALAAAGQGADAASQVAG